MYVCGVLREGGNRARARAGGGGGDIGDKTVHE